MKLETKACYKDVCNDILQMGSIITQALKNKELVDEHFNVVNKFSFTWIMLALASPFYTLFGRDAFSHVRVDAVARKIFTYCDLNKQYITPALQQELTELIGKLDSKTTNKYNETLSNISTCILQISTKTKAFWLHLRTGLESLATASWNNQIPKFDDASNDLDKLAAIFNALQLVQKNSEVSQVSADTVQAVLEKAWSYSCAMADLSSSIKACTICLSYMHGAISPSSTFTFTNGEKLEIPTEKSAIFANRFDFLQTHGAQCAKSELRSCTAEKVRAVINQSQNLVSLVLSDCSQLTDDDLKGIESCTMLQSLSLNSWHELTHRGLEYIKNLPSLKNLDIRYCPNISRVRHFWILDEQIKAGLKITSIGCEEDVEQEKENAKQLEQTRNFQAKIKDARTSGYVSGRTPPAHLSEPEQSAWLSGVFDRHRSGRR
jgi:hypothetical protein